MTRNGSTAPFPNELTTPPTWRSQTSRGSCGSKRPSSLIRPPYRRVSRERRRLGCEQNQAARYRGCRWANRRRTRPRNACDRRIGSRLRHCCGADPRGVAWRGCALARLSAAPVHGSASATHRRQDRGEGAPSGGRADRVGRSVRQPPGGAAPAVGAAAVGGAAVRVAGCLQLAALACPQRRCTRLGCGATTPGSSETTVVSCGRSAEAFTGVNTAGKGVTWVQVIFPIRYHPATSTTTQTTLEL